MSENIRFAKSKVTNLRGPSNSLLFFKNWRGLSASFQNKTGGGGPGPYGRYAYDSGVARWGRDGRNVPLPQTWKIFKGLGRDHAPSCNDNQ